ncbi:hypothetical protein GCM10028826_08320 [Mucilaginibacter boryungensis]
MIRIEIECSTCGSTYIIASQRTEKLNQGSISCFVCDKPVFTYNGYIEHYPFLKNKQEKHLQVEGIPLPDKLLDKENNDQD